MATLADALAAAVTGGADANRIADDLFAVSAILVGEPGLRRVLTDVAVVSEAKSDLIRGILADKVAPASLELVAQAAGSRWAATRHLADSLESLAVVAVVKGAEQSNEADALEDQLFAVGRLLADNPELRDALSDPARNAADKRGLLAGLLGDKVTTGTFKLVSQALAGTYRTVPVAIAAYQKVAADNRNRLVATVRAARPVGTAERGRLQAALGAQYGKPVYINVIVDTEVLGGLRVEIGDDVIDGTVIARLDDAGRRLAG
jgi:F-type H+-transporting ATPase subunit delta